MRMSSVLNDALNTQMLRELANSLLYTQISSWFSERGLNNLGAYFLKQAIDERGHSDKILKHLQDRVGASISFADGVELPGLPVENAIGIGDTYLFAEEDTTANIESLYKLALEESSFIDIPLLNEMLAEQVEEEASARDFLDQIKAVKDLVLFDKEFEG